MTKLFTSLLALLLLCGTASAQFSAYTSADAGSFMTHGGKSAFACRGQAEIINYSDTATGIAFGERAGVFYADTKDDIQGASFFLIAKKSLGLLGGFDPFVTLGGGVLYEITDGNDTTSAAMKLEIGADIYKKFGFQIGCDYSPVKDGADNYFVYAGLNLTPSIKK